MNGYNFSCMAGLFTAMFGWRWSSYMMLMERDGRVGKMLWQSGAILLMAVFLGLVVNQIRPDGLHLLAGWSPKDPLTSQTGEVLSVSLDQAHKMFADRAAVFIDARSPDLYMQGHIPGARNLPWYEFDEYFDVVMSDIPFDALIISYCEGTRCLSGKELAVELFFRGYENVRVLASDWKLLSGKQLPAGVSPPKVSDAQDVK